ncbi:ATP-binding protein [Paenibacillus sp. ACRRX]|uniref:ATP-binding protein n=1 Tax=unclassified Paenibacillus TaxID=185978 RepID=UPI001EF704CD|nr:ATP-binding protein [Paenibacillus sp. UMB4589-SE434]MCG7408639.1 ATP-binding protein [Paenibacillus sp. ACRRX]MDK8182884.1 ATP-binding protein [Paenibacillus sp. UMB4589-SE434]
MSIINKLDRPVLVPFQAGMTDYEHFAQAVKAVQLFLSERYGKSWLIISNENRLEEAWDRLDDDVQLTNAEVELAATVYDFFGVRDVIYEEGSRFAEQDVAAGYKISSSIQNLLYVYPSSEVAFVRIPVWMHYGTDSEKVCFAASDEAMLRFMNETQIKRRERERNSITVFTDTNNGVDRETERLTRSVQREDVVMDDKLKKELFRSIDRFFDSDSSFYTTYRVPYKRGILLYGRPGNGKTTLVKSIAGSVSAPVAYWQITEHTSSHSIDEVFNEAVKMAPMVLVIEDIDAMPEHARSFFLNTLDGATSKEGIFLIGTTNYPEKIDPALMNRAGRFDRAYEMPLPERTLRLQYLRQLGLVSILGEEEEALAADLTEAFSFAQLNEVYLTIALLWYDKEPIDLHQIVRDMKQTLDKGRKQTWFKGNDTVGFLG